MDISEGLISDIIEEGDEDYLDISTIAYLYKLEGDVAPDELDGTATEIAVELVRRGLIVPGVLNNGFRPWDLPVDKAAEVIQRDAQRALRESTMLAPGQICWFDITERARAEYLKTSG